MTPAGLASGEPAPSADSDPDTAALPVQGAGDTDADDLLGSPDPGPLLTAGATADVFAVDEARVLRRYHGDHDGTYEAQITRHVVAHGFPAPAVAAAAGADIVMERLHGPTLLQSLAADETTLNDGAAILADLHARLHALPAPAAGTLPTSTSWPAPPTGDAVVHLGLHPGNVVLTEQHGPAVIDWANARLGTAELDVALTALLISEVAVDAGGVYSQAARALLAAFLAAVDVDVVAGLDDAVGLRVQDPSLVAGERDLVPAAATLVRELVEVAGRH